MARRWAAVLTAAGWLATAAAQSSTSSAAFATTSIAPQPLASIIQDTGYVPENLIDPAATLLAGIANGYQAAIVGILNKTGVDPQKLLDPEAYYNGRSPPVYPSPEGVGEGEWASAYTQAKAMVSQMTIEEKNSIVVPAKNTNGCSGFTGNVTRLGFPGICLNDAENGIRIDGGGNVSAFPAQLSVGASWDKGLAWWRAYYLGAEFKAKGVNVALGPVVGPIGRVAKGGRNWEGFSNDPYLAGSLVAPSVEGIQESVIACVKHFIANEQETNRNPFLQGFGDQIGLNLNNSVSSNLDDKTMHELYLWPFYDAVKAGAGSVMASYNRVNNSYACQNSKTINGLLKTELGFKGFALSDWFGQHTGVASAEAGLDLVMPSGIYWENHLAEAVKNGSLAASRLDDMNTRILTAWYRYAKFEKPGLTPNEAVDARTPAADQIILQAAVEGHVLVKNVNSALPLKKPKTMSIFGWDAIGGLNKSGDAGTLYSLSLSNSQQYTTGGKAFTELDYLLLVASIQTGAVPEVAFNGTMMVGGGSGGVTPASSVAPYDALLRQAATDGTTLHTDFVSQNPVVQPSDACLILINAQSSEGADRLTLADEYSDTLVTNVASQCSNTIVVLHNAGIRLVDRWVNNPNVTAAMFAHLPGQASGDALVEVLYGRQSPSGRLPYTVAKKESDYGALLDPTMPTTENPQYSQSNFDEGVFIDYRHFIKNGIEPRFPFGFGLTYTTFTYSNLTVECSSWADKALAPPDASSPAPEGGLASLYDTIATATVTVKNTGAVAAAEVAQLYVGIPNSGVEKALRGFDKHWIQPGETATYSFLLRRRDLSNWDTEKQQWMLQTGAYKLYAGKSVLDIQLTDTLTL